jgi:hypothetical protein
MDAAFEWLVLSLVAAVCGGPLWIAIRRSVDA